jgi:hypothetical protein
MRDKQGTVQGLKNKKKLLIGENVYKNKQIKRKTCKYFNISRNKENERKLNFSD